MHEILVNLSCAHTREGMKPIIVKQHSWYLSARRGNFINSVACPERYLVKNGRLVFSNRTFCEQYSVKNQINSGSTLTPDRQHSTSIFPLSILFRSSDITETRAVI